MTRGEIDALARRIVLATMGTVGYPPIAYTDEDAASDWFQQAAEDRRRIAERYEFFRRSPLPFMRCAEQASVEWLAGMLTEAFGASAGRDALEPAIETIRVALATAPGDTTRYDLLARIADGYCRYCGGRDADSPCKCMMDE